MYPFQEQDQGFSPIQYNAINAQGQNNQPVSILPGGQNGLSLGNFGTGSFGGNLQLGLGAIQTLGSLWNSFEQNKLAKKAFKFQKQAFETNTRNQTKSYNTALEDRIRARYNTENRSSEADEYINRNKL